MRRTWRSAAAVAVGLLTLSAAPATGTTNDTDTTLSGRAVLPGDTFADGPTSGRFIGDGPFNGNSVPFEDAQPVQGFSAMLRVDGGQFWAMSDNGFGTLENSADYELRIYRIEPAFEVATTVGFKPGLTTGDGGVEVLEHITLRDPNGLIPFATTNHFTEERILTGADFDIESMQIDANGDIWIGDEFGPFLLHFDAEGVLLESPIALPDGEGGELRAPQNPYNEESSTQRVMNAVRTHAELNGNTRAPVVSPWHVMLADGMDDTFVGSRETPPDGLAAASSEIHDVARLQQAGYPVVPYTINDSERMTELLELGVDGIISDRTDLLYEAIADFDADGDGTPGDYLLDDGRIDIEQIDAQGHRGARNLRPENTLPGMEVALDDLMTTLELDTGVTLDGIAVLDHDPAIESGKCREADGSTYADEDEVLVRDLTAEEIQARFICDAVFRGDEQTADLELSPVSVAFAEEHGLMDPYVMPTLQQVFDFVDFYVEYYESGDGAGAENAAVLAANAAEVRFNIETKMNPRAEFADRTLEPQAFVDATAGLISENALDDRADVQSFDWRSLLLIHEQFPTIRTVFLFGDFPQVGEQGDGTNLQDESGANTPWLAGLHWPYRVTSLSEPFEVPGSGGFEGMAYNSATNKLYPLLEKPLVGEDGFLRVFMFDPATSSYVDVHWLYPLDERGTAIGDMQWIGGRRFAVIERDGSQGDLGGFKAITEIELLQPYTVANKALAVDLLDIADPNGISDPARSGDVGIGDPFAFPFVTIEDLIILDRNTILVANDNNFPFSVGRNGDAADGETIADDNEIIILELSTPLGDRVDAMN